MVGAILVCVAHGLRAGGVQGAPTIGLILTGEGAWNETHKIDLRSCSGMRPGKDTINSTKLKFC